MLDHQNLPELAPQQILTFSYYYKDSRGIPVDPKFVRTRSELNWDEVVSRSIPYSISHATSGRDPTCAGCRKIIDNDQMRIRTSMLWSSPLHPSLPQQVRAKPRMFILIICLSIQYFNNYVCTSIQTCCNVY